MHSQLSYKVCALIIDSSDYEEFAVVWSWFVRRIPLGISVVEAAAVPHAALLTFFALSVLTNATLGKKVMVHEDSWGVDIIAIQYVKHLGCDVFAVAATEEKLRLFKTLGARVCINYNKEDLCKRVKAETRGQGVDIILDPSGKDFLKKMDCLARGGSILLIGGKETVDIDLSYLLNKDISIKGACMEPMACRQLTLLWYDAATRFWPLIEAGNIRVIIGKIFTFGEAAKAQSPLDDDNNILGKILLVPH